MLMGYRIRKEKATGGQKDWVRGNIGRKRAHWRTCHLRRDTWFLRMGASVGRQGVVGDLFC